MSPTPGEESRRFLYCCRCGHTGVQVESPMCHRCVACGFGHYMNPIAGVVALLTDRVGRLLLLRRAHDPGRGQLGLPGGFVDLGESAEQALRREIREEVGLEVPTLTYYVSLPNEYPYQGLVTPVLDLFYRGTLDDLEQARAVSEVQALVIRAPRDVDVAEMAFPSNAEAVRRLAAEPDNGSSLNI